MIFRLTSWLCLFHIPIFKLFLNCKLYNTYEKYQKYKWLWQMLCVYIYELARNPWYTDSYKSFVENQLFTTQQICQFITQNDMEDPVMHFVCWSYIQLMPQFEQIWLKAKMIINCQVKISMCKIFVSFHDKFGNF